jgi:hypothetical protein
VKRPAKKQQPSADGNTAGQQQRLSRVIDGGVLKTLPNGIKLIRRKTHEWVKSLDPKDRANFERKTNPFFGSKFLPRWSLPRYVVWLERKMAELKWSAAAPKDDAAIFKEPMPVGYSKGKLVHTIEVVIDNGFVHAYPVQD